jgi:hypothetical protein
MPNPDDRERKGKNNEARFQALWARAQSNANPQSWSEWWSAGISRLSSAGSTAGSAAKSGAQHVALHTTAKLVMYGVGVGVATFVLPVGWIGGIVAWGVGGLTARLGEEAVEKLADYGGGIAEDWIKSCAEEGSGKAVSAVSGVTPPTPTEEKQKNLREDTDKMFATIGGLDVLMRQMDDLNGKPLKYCDDGNLVARLQARIDEEIASAKSQISNLKRQLGSLESFIQRSENTNNRNRSEVKAAVKRVVKASAAPHWTNTIADNLAAMYRCSKQHCFGPGTGSPANDLS